MGSAGGAYWLSLLESAGDVISPRLPLRFLLSKALFAHGMQLIPQTVLTLQTASALFSFAVDVLHVVLDSVELRLSAQSPPGQFQARRATADAQRDHQARS